MKFEFIADPAWITMKAFSYWLRAVEIFWLLVSVLLAYYLIQIIKHQKGDEDA